MEAIDALKRWPVSGPLQPIDGGLINRTFQVGDPVQAVLQWLNPIFAPEVNLEIAALSSRLTEGGLPSPQVLPTHDGRLWVSDDKGCWRMLEWIPGQTVDRLHTTAQATEVGSLVGRFHAVLDGWQRQRVAPVRRIHETPTRLKELAAALHAADRHALEGPARALGTEVLEAWKTWDGSLELPERICHGDLKISNVRFRKGRAHCLIDLDTVGPMPLSCELGDAWRSWCNPAGEDDPKAARLELPLFEASASAFLKQGPQLTGEELNSLVPGIERICLELTARFCADAVQNTYFKEDRTRFPQVGGHNLHRARAQFELARSARKQRSACEAVIATAHRNP